jgi:hypothetical protein
MLAHPSDNSPLFQCAGLQDRQAVADQNALLNERARREKLSLVLQLIHILEMLGHKGQHLFGSGDGFAQRNEESFLEHCFAECRDFIVFFWGHNPLLSILKSVVNIPISHAFNFTSRQLVRNDSNE